MNQFGYQRKPPVFAKQYYYLASPYSSPSEATREARAVLACKAMVWLQENKYLAFSPILQGHAMWHEKPSLPFTHEYWKTVDELFISKSAGVIVLCLAGWMDSRGIKSEVEFSIKSKLPVYKLEATDENFRSFSFVD